MKTINIPLLEKRKKSFNEFVNLQEEALNDDAVNTDVNFYFFNLPLNLASQQETLFLIDNELYQEDYGTFKFLVNFFKKRAKTQIDESDFIVLPFNINFYQDIETAALSNVIKEVRELAGDKRVLMFSIGDFCAKPGNRSTKFERELFGSIPNLSKVISPYTRPSDIIICFESTIDLIFHDLPIFPLADEKQALFSQENKEYLFSFVGGYYKDGWPQGFVRSPENKVVWEALIARSSQHSLILSTEKAQQLYSENPFYEIPKKSTFTLCPRGIASWSFRLFEAIRFGSIPVILSDSYVKPFSKFIPWDYFSLTYPESSLSEIDALLENISNDTINQLSQNLNENQHWFSSRGLIKLVLAHLKEQTQDNAKAMK